MGNRRKGKGQKYPPHIEAQRKRLERLKGISLQPQRGGGHSGGRRSREIPTGGEFQNPFNFIRATDNENRRPFTPHNVASAELLSGEILIKAEVVTPLMIGGKRTKDQHTNNHKIVEFYKENGKYCVPSTSLKGMVRSAFESVTNSCFLHMKQSDYVGYRQKPSGGSDINIGRITELPTMDHDGIIENGSVVTVRHSLLREKDLGQFVNVEEVTSPVKVSIRLDSQGSLCKDIIKGHTNNDGWIHAYLKPTGSFGRKKHDEKIYIPGNSEIHFSYSDFQRYLACNAHGWYDKLNENDIIYFQDKGPGRIDICSTQIGKLPYNRSIYTAANKAQKPCKSLDKLCPACRVFGNILRDDDKNTIEALAGRIRVSKGIINGRHNDQAIPLQVLGSPHPSCVAFYLEGDHLYKGYDDNSSSIRGRKVYLHNLNPNFKYSDNPIPKKGGFEPEKNKMNVSAKGMLVKGGFTFKLRFDGITQFDLGALLFVLDCQEGHGLKLGLGKPIGLGSIRTSVESLTVFDLNKRYSSLEDDGILEKDISKYLSAYKMELSSIEGTDFDKIPYIVDYVKASTFNLLAGQNIKYPSAKDDRGVKKGFLWFMKNKEDYKRREYPTQVLPKLEELPEKSLKEYE